MDQPKEATRIFWLDVQPLGQTRSNMRREYEMMRLCGPMRVATAPRKKKQSGRCEEPIGAADSR